MLDDCDSEQTSISAAHTHWQACPTAMKAAMMRAGFLEPPLLALHEPQSRRPASIVRMGWYDIRTAMVLHWTLALLLTMTTAAGVYMTSIEDKPGSGWYFDTHKSVGIVIALLVAAGAGGVARGESVERLPASVPMWQVKLAHGTRAMLYILMVLMPVTG